MATIDGMEINFDVVETDNAKAEAMWNVFMQKAKIHQRYAHIFVYEMGWQTIRDFYKAFSCAEEIKEAWCESCLLADQSKIEFPSRNMSRIRSAWSKCGETLNAIAKSTKKGAPDDNVDNPLDGPESESYWTAYFNRYHVYPRCLVVLASALSATGLGR